ncbi:MAG TPA: hypothetical protein PK606_13720, partial [Ottowia sp.]|uniref:hypothetical protein n=1 Tax=Ottowia sp. TaxID=1898956 RepID=UPI002CAC1DF9
MGVSLRRTGLGFCLRAEARVEVKASKKSRPALPTRLASWSLQSSLGGLKSEVQHLTRRKVLR